MTKRIGHSQSKKKHSQTRRRVRVIDRYKSEAKEIAAAKQAMERLHKGIEFESERLHYVTALHLL